MTESSENEPSGRLLHHLTLGKSVDYQDQYTPELLQAVPRAMNREPLGLTDGCLPFQGLDLWTGYELSWLNLKGKPEVAIMQCEVPVDTPNLIESKSFKLYLNSFNQSRFCDHQTVTELLVNDLSRCAGGSVKVTLVKPAQFQALAVQELKGDCIDELDVEITRYQPDPGLLTTAPQMTEETLVSHLLKSNCLITQQPDWASIQIRYAGTKIEHASLLKYLVSFRQHNEFHEQCVERIFCDILTQCRPNKLTVYARYTRRGGLDINPYRSNFEPLKAYHRLARQ